MKRKDLTIVYHTLGAMVLKKDYDAMKAENLELTNRVSLLVERNIQEANKNHGECHVAFEKIKADRDRLRVALENIKKNCDASQMYLFRLAREALEQSKQSEGG